MHLRLLMAAGLFAFSCGANFGHVGPHPSVHDTVANILERLKRQFDREALLKMSTATLEQQLSSAEREVLGKEHISFRVNVPVVVSIIQPPNPAETPFWLRERGFENRPGDWVHTSTNKFVVWQKRFDSGRIGLGVNSIGGGGSHYLIALAPQTNGQLIAVSELYPGQLRTASLQPGVKAYADRTEVLTNVPPEFAGQTLIQTLYSRRDDGRIKNVLRWTEHPSSDRPDHVILTWDGDPKTTQAIQWRTSSKTDRAYVRFQKKADANPLLAHKRKVSQLRARTEKIQDNYLVNDPVAHHHTVSLSGLEPGTTYVYTVGSGKHWTIPAEFTTAPAGVEPFSFIYMGDAQNGLDRWGSLMQSAFRSRPDVAFYVMAGDLVNRGAERDDWDSLFHNARGIYDRRQLVPVLGNHEYQGGKPEMYLKHFQLPTNGPGGIDPEKAYSFTYGNALFVILDSNLDPETQSEWLDAQLGNSKAKWKFVAYHHPAYSSGPDRDNKKLREVWTKIFDKHHVDMALQGHDHAYLRTYPMKGEKRAKSTAEGTVYVVSVSGTKMYKQDPRDYTEFGMTNVSTYQVLDIQISGDRLVYRAWDIDGKLRDEVIIEK